MRIYEICNMCITYMTYIYVTYKIYTVSMLTYIALISLLLFLYLCSNLWRRKRGRKSDLSSHWWRPRRWAARHCDRCPLEKLPAGRHGHRRREIQRFHESWCLRCLHWQGMAKNDVLKKLKDVEIEKGFFSALGAQFHLTHECVAILAGFMKTYYENCGCLLPCL